MRMLRHVLAAALVCAAAAPGISHAFSVAESQKGSKKIVQWASDTIGYFLHPAGCKQLNRLEKSRNTHRCLAVAAKQRQIRQKSKCYYRVLGRRYSQRNILAVIVGPIWLKNVPAGFP